MNDDCIKIGIVSYAECMHSAVYGLSELFVMANMMCAESSIDSRFSVEIYTLKKIKQEWLEQTDESDRKPLRILIIPPNIEGDYYLKPDSFLLEWIVKQHALGSTICSACAGAFILAATGLLHNRMCTTHWELAENFSVNYPNVALDSNKILINDGDIMTAGGVMSWVDLGLELVAQLVNSHVMRRLGKFIVVDTGLREQRYYKSMSPRLDHGDGPIIKTQHYMQVNYHTPITSTALSELCFLTERTFLRRFVKATGLKPMQYLQHLRIHKACELIETTNNTVDNIAAKVGYEDSSAFRKTFVKIIGLTPREFRSRFSSAEVCTAS